MGEGMAPVTSRAVRWTPSSRQDQNLGKLLQTRNWWAFSDTWVQEYVSRDILRSLDISKTSKKDYIWVLWTRRFVHWTRRRQLLFFDGMPFGVRLPFLYKRFTTYGRKAKHSRSFWQYMYRVTNNTIRKRVTIKRYGVKRRLLLPYAVEEVERYIDCFQPGLL